MIGPRVGLASRPANLKEIRIASGISAFIEGDDTSGTAVLIVQQVADKRLGVGICLQRSRARRGRGFRRSHPAPSRYPGRPTARYLRVRAATSLARGVPPDPDYKWFASANDFVIGFEHHRPTASRRSVRTVPAGANVVAIGVVAAAAVGPGRSGSDRSGPDRRRTDYRDSRSRDRPHHDSRSARHALRQRRRPEVL